MAALFIAEKAGVKFQEIPLGAALVPGLRSGQVDGIVFSALITLREIDAGQARSLIDLTSEMPPTLANVYVASQEMIDKRPQELRAALAAIYEALAYMRERALAGPVIASLAAWARDNVADGASLQVEAGNMPALALYAGFGLGEIYRYHYRREPPRR